MKLKILVIVLIAAMIAGCSQSYLSQGRKHLANEQYDNAIDAFYKQIAANSSDYKAWQELGVAFYKKGNLVKAEDALKQANGITPDSRTNLFLGLIYEKQDQWDKALEAFGTSLSLNPDKKTAASTRTHIDLLLAKRLEAEVAQSIANEEAINIDTIPNNTIAVSNFDASLLSPDLAPLARGLSEIVSVDLSKVVALTVIERQKIDVIMDELKRGTSGYVDPASAPRVGKLLGTNKIVTGTVMGLGEEGFRINGVVVKTADGSTQNPEAKEGELKNLFKVQKDFVFALIDSLGITLSQTERDAIEKVPTESYLAFLAYCRGLDYEERGMYKSSQQEFNKALELDANFEQAGSELRSVAGMENAPSLEVSQMNLENIAVNSGADIPAATNGLDNRLTNVIINAGAYPGGVVSSVTNEPPVVGPTNATGTVIIRGDLDGQ
ncbi:MAG: tetratricopeptide repeat protein [bacterium]